MATAREQARYRARDGKRLVQVRLSPEALDRLDRMVNKRGASGRAEILEDILMGSAPDPLWLVSVAARLLRAYFEQTGESSAQALNDAEIVDIAVYRLY